MQSMMTSFLLPLLVLIAGCHCAPARTGLGWNIGGSSSFNLAGGGIVKSKRDGFALKSEADGAAGGNLKAEGHTGYYMVKDDEYTAGRVAVGGTVGGVVKPGARTAIGVDSNGNILTGFQPAVNIKKTLDGGFNAERLTEEDARRYAKKHDYGGFFENDRTESNSAFEIY